FGSVIEISRVAEPVVSSRSLLSRRSAGNRTQLHPDLPLSVGSAAACPLKPMLCSSDNDNSEFAEASSKQESEFSHGSGLTPDISSLTKCQTGRYVAQVNIRHVASHEEPSGLKRWSPGD